MSPLLRLGDKETHVTAGDKSGNAVLYVKAYENEEPKKQFLEYILSRTILEI